MIEYTVAHSDNNTCDLLIEFVGGIKNVDTYIKSLGIKDLNLTETEHDMHENIMNCYNNWVRLYLLHNY
ncbi:MAG: serine hydrolase [Barnesiella sp.]